MAYMNTSFFEIDNQSTPIIATAIHDGHFIREELRSFMLLNEQERAREEDPYTGFMIDDLPVTKIKVSSSRFQLDLNRFIEKAIYEKPEDAWGLNVWKSLPEGEKKKLHGDYDAFYDAVKQVLDETINKHGYALILDVHTYNHRRDDAFNEADSEANPEINMGTFYNTEKWKALCSDYTQFLTDQNFDARENVKFKGGAFAQWMINNYGDKICVLSVEFKKTFMDEWTGIADVSHLIRLQKLLSKSVDFLNQQVKTYL